MSIGHPASGRRCPGVSQLVRRGQRQARRRPRGRPDRTGGRRRPGSAAGSRGCRWRQLDVGAALTFRRHDALEPGDGEATFGRESLPVTITSAMLESGTITAPNSPYRKAAFHWSMPRLHVGRKIQRVLRPELCTGKPGLRPVEAQGIGGPRAGGDDAPPLVGTVGATWGCDVGTGSAATAATQAEQSIGR